MAKDVELKHYNPVNYEQFMYGELLSTLVKQNNVIIEQNEKIVKALTANTEQTVPAPKTKSTEKTTKSDTKDSTKE